MVGAGFLLATLPLWLRPGVLPEACGNDVPPPSAAKWVWHAGAKPKDGAELYCRRTFVLPSVAKGARVRFKADDVGALYLNGRRIMPPNFAQGLHVGTNVVAAYTRNAVGFGGLIFRAEIDCADGAHLEIVSDRNFRAAAQAPADWVKSDFDDSAWRQAVELGDVSLRPWSEMADLARDFASASEYDAIRTWRTTLPPIDESALAAEPEPQVTVRYRGAQPFINVNGHDLPPYLNLAGVAHRFARASVLKTAALGFPFFELQFEAGIERAAGEYDFTQVDRQAHQLLNLVPTAYIFLRFRTNFPKWCAAHRDECVGYGKGEVGSKAGDDLRGRSLRPSAASAAYRAELSRFHDRLGAFVRSRPWAKRVVACRACWGVYTEWHTYGFYECPDTGRAMTAAFRRCLGGKYAQDNVPSVAECERPYPFLDPEKDAKTIDFFRCVSDETMALQLSMARDLKRNFPGRLVGAYSGYVFTAFPPVGQNCRYDVLMKAPELDFCSAPASYAASARRPGGSCMQRVIPESFRRHGKLLLFEDDMRFHHVKEWDPKRAHTDTPAESAAVMRRNFLLTLFDGCGIQLCDPFNGIGRRLHAFDDPAVLGAMHEAQTALAKVGQGRLASVDGNVLVLVDSLARYRWSANTAAHASLLSALSAELPHHLHTCGVAVDIADVHDYLAFDYPHRIVCVADALALSSDEVGALCARLKKSEVSAFRLEMPGGAQMPGALASVPLPRNAEEWRRVLLEKGAHAWTDGGYFLRRHGNLVGVSVAKPGEYRLYLPDCSDGAVELFSGRTYAGREIVFATNGPGTLLFRFR